jgi:hypothetical protein
MHGTPHEADTMSNTRDENQRRVEGDLPDDTDPFVDSEVVGAPLGALKPIADMAREGLERADARKRGEEEPVPVPWKEYAGIIGGGLWPGMHVLVGGTGAGKTTFAVQIGIAAASKGCPVAYVGLELDEPQIGLRMVAETGWSKLYLGKHGPGQRAEAKSRLERMADWPLYGVMGDPSGWPASKLEGIAASLRAEAERRANGTPPKPGLIVLDFLQLVGNEAADKRTELRERIGRAAYTARQVARKHNVAVVLVSSAARDKYAALAGGCAGAGLVTKRTKDGKPCGVIYRPDELVGTGKESGEIEYAADSVTVLVKMPNAYGAPVVLCCVPKLRYGQARWTPMVFEDQRFRPVDVGLVAKLPPTDEEAEVSDVPDTARRCQGCGKVYDEVRMFCPACDCPVMDADSLPMPPPKSKRKPKAEADKGKASDPAVSKLIRGDD